MQIFIWRGTLNKGVMDNFIYFDFQIQVIQKCQHC